MSQVTYGAENPFAMSHVVTCSGVASNVSGKQLPDARSTRIFLTGWDLFSVIFFNNSLLTLSTVSQKQDDGRRQSKSNNKY